VKNFGHFLISSEDVELFKKMEDELFGSQKVRFGLNFGCRIGLGLEKFFLSFFEKFLGLLLLFSGSKFLKISKNL